MANFHAGCVELRDLSSIALLRQAMYKDIEGHSSKPQCNLSFNILADLLDWHGLCGCHCGAANSTVVLCTRILRRSLALGLSTTSLGSLQAAVFLSSCFALHASLGLASAQTQWCAHLHAVAEKANSPHGCRARRRVVVCLATLGACGQRGGVEERT